MSYDKKKDGSEEKKAVKENIFKKTLWDQDDVSKRKLFIIERMDNLLALGIRYWDTQEGKFDFKYGTAAYLRYEEADILLSTLKGAVTNVEFTLAHPENANKGIVYSAIIDIPKREGKYNGITVDAKVQDDVVIFGVKIDNGTKADYVLFEGLYTAKVSVNKSVVDVVNNPALLEFKTLVTALESYLTDSMRNGNFVQKMIGGTPSGGGRHQSADDGEYPF